MAEPTAWIDVGADVELYSGSGACVLPRPYPYASTGLGMGTCSAGTTTATLALATATSNADDSATLRGCSTGADEGRPRAPAGGANGDDGDDGSMAAAASAAFVPWLAAVLADAAVAGASVDGSAPRDSGDAEPGVRVGVDAVALAPPGDRRMELIARLLSSSPLYRAPPSPVPRPVDDAGTAVPEEVEFEFDSGAVDGDGDAGDDVRGDGSEADAPMPAVPPAAPKFSRSSNESM